MRKQEVGAVKPTLMDIPRAIAKPIATSRPARPLWISN